MPELAMALDIWSNLAYVVAAAFCIHHILKSGKVHSLSLFLVGLIFCIALGSSAYHAFQTPWAQISDVIPCWTFMMTYIGAALYYMLEISKIRTMIIMMLFSFSLAFTGTFYLEAPSVPWLPAGAMLWFLSIGLYNRNRSSWYSVAVGALCFTLGLILKAANPWVLQYIEFGTHWIWHIITAIMLVYLTNSLHDSFSTVSPGQKRVICNLEAQEGA